MKPVLLARIAFAALALSACDRAAEGRSAGPAARSVAASAVAAPSPIAASPSGPAPAVPAQASPRGDAPLRPGGTTLEAPDALGVALLYASLARGSAPVQGWVEQDLAERRPTEFERPKLEAALKADYGTKLADAAQIGALRVSVSGELSRYDERYGQYYLDAFGASSYLSYTYRGQTYRLDYVNRDQAQGWKLSPAEAADVLARNNGGRSVVVTADLDIVGHAPRENGGVIRTRVHSYTVESRYEHTRLGHVDLPAAPG